MKDLGIVKYRPKLYQRVPNGGKFKTVNIVSWNSIRLEWPRSQNPNVTDTSFSNKIMDSAQLIDNDKKMAIVLHL